MSEEWREFDLSALTYPEFLAFIFDRPVVSHPEAYQLFHSGLEILVSDPVIVVDHVRKMCKELGGLRSSYSIEQMDQGLWAHFGTVISRGEFFDSVVNPSMRIECIESMYFPFAEVATDFTSDIRETFIGCGGTLFSTTFGRWLTSTNSIMRL